MLQCGKLMESPHPNYKRNFLSSSKKCSSGGADYKWTRCADFDAKKRNRLCFKINLI